MIIFPTVLLVTPHKNCRLKLLKLERIKDFLLMEDEFIQNQERLKPQEEKNEVIKHANSCGHTELSDTTAEKYLITSPLLSTENL